MESDKVMSWRIFRYGVMAEAGAITA